MLCDIRPAESTITTAKKSVSMIVHTKEFDRNTARVETVYRLPLLVGTEYVMQLKEEMATGGCYSFKGRIVKPADGGVTVFDADNYVEMSHLYEPIASIEYTIV